MQNIISYPNLWLTMKSRRLKQFDLAAMLKCSDVTISRKLRGLQPLTATEKEVIARELAINVVWLFSEAIIPQSAVETTMLSLDHVEKR